MNYTELSIAKAGLNEEDVEILIAILSDNGFEGFEEDDSFIKAFCPEAIVKNGISLILDKFSLVGTKDLSYSIRNIPGQNWNEQWEKNFSPIVIDNRILIKAPFHKNPDLEFTIIIEPKMSFGTGHHETTRLMLREMLRHDFSGKEVLDMGCGTGVLGIAAKMMGASYLLAVDIDVWAQNNSMENFQRNNIRQPYDVIVGDCNAVEGHKFHVVLANINRNILLNDLPVYFQALKESGTLVISGILSSDREILVETAKQCGFNFISSAFENNWISLNFRK